MGYLRAAPGLSGFSAGYASACCASLLPVWGQRFADLMHEQALHRLQIYRQNAAQTIEKEQWRAGVLPLPGCTR